MLSQDEFAPPLLIYKDGLWSTELRAEVRTIKRFILVTTVVSVGAFFFAGLLALADFFLLPVTLALVGTLLGWLFTRKIALRYLFACGFGCFGNLVFLIGSLASMDYRLGLGDGGCGMPEAMDFFANAIFGPPVGLLAGRLSVSWFLDREDARLARVLETEREEWLSRAGNRTP